MSFEFAKKRKKLKSGGTFSKTKKTELMSFDTRDHAPGLGSEESSSLWFLEELNRNEDPSRWMPDLKEGS